MDNTVEAENGNMVFLRSHSNSHQMGLMKKLVARLAGCDDHLCNIEGVNYWNVCKS